MKLDTIQYVRATGYPHRPRARLFGIASIAHPRRCRKFENPSHKPMNSERRHSFRKVPDAPAYIQLSLDNSGTLLNVSEQGLAFQAVAPVYREGPILCWFSFDPAERIEA